MKVNKIKYCEGDQNEVLWRWSKWNMMKVISKWNIIKLIWKWKIMKMTKMKYYEGVGNEILRVWSKSNIIKVIKMKYYQGDLEMKNDECDENEIL